MGVLGGSLSFYEYHITDAIEYNLLRRLEYGLVEKGAFTVMDENSDFYTLKRVKNPRVDQGVVYEGLGKNWLWETQAHNDVLVAQDVYVDEVVTPANIDFSNGLVYFDSEIDSSSVVQCEYSFPDVAVYNKNSETYKKLVSAFVSKLEELDENNDSTGIAQIIKDKRVWLPAVFINVTLRGQSGYEMGGTNLGEFFIVYSIYSDTEFACKTLTDILCQDYNQLIRIFDPNHSAAVFPYEPNGKLKSGAQQYLDLIEDYHLTKGYIESVSSNQPKERFPGLWESEVRQTFKAIFPS